MMLTYILLIITMLSWSANTVFALLSVGEASPMVIVFFRWLGVSLLLLVFVYPHIRQDWPEFIKRKGYFLRMALLGFSFFNGLYYIASHSTTAANLGILQGSIPVFVLLGSVFFYQTRLTSIQIIGVFITLLGVVLVSVKGDWNIFINLAFSQGDLLMLLACFVFAAYSLGLRQRPNIHPLSFFSYLAFLAFLSTIPLLGIEVALGQSQYPTVKGWVIITLITLFPSFLSQILYIISVQNIGPARASVFVNLIPIMSTIMAAVVLKEHIQWFHYTALMMVLGGIALSELKKVKPNGYEACKKHK